MNWKSAEKFTAYAVLAYAFIIYVLTVSPTASFWDSGEFIAIANKLEVSHPPGAPFFMLVGRLFSMFVPAGLVALSINMMSVLSSALTVLLTHLIIVRLVREWQGPEIERTNTQRLAALVGGVVGACTFAVTDSFWFNAVEAEVYAMSMLFTALVVWLIMKWAEEARVEAAQLGRHVPVGLSANRYIVLIAYLFGLAIGVHLLNLLALFFLALIVYFTEYDRDDLSNGERFAGIVKTGIVSMVAFVAVYPGIVQWLPTLAGMVSSLSFFLVAVTGLIVWSVYYTHTKRMQTANLLALVFAMVMIGYSTYAVIFIRSASNPPIDENDPETTEAIVSYLKREQYGSVPHLSGPTFDNVKQAVDPNNEVSFPRRWSPDPLHATEYRRYKSDMEFFIKYQLGHMYWRYFLWNFLGKASDIQDSPAILFASDAPEYYFQTPSERASRNLYFALPLILGLFGAAFQFSRDWRRAFAVFILFFVSGVGIIIYLNQPPFQPRERDYSYVASFFAFALWIGVGATGILELVGDLLKKESDRISPVLFGLAGLIFAAVPMWMLYQNYDDHDRSGRYVAPDYAYNMLMSLEENAIVFTNGDNDTFPLWYLQEVEGVRTDVRVTNLSLLNTSWYARQLKTQSSRESTPLPISFGDDDIANLQVQGWRPREVELPVDKNLIANSELPTVLDTSLIESPMRWNLQGRPYSEDINILHGADQMALDIILTNARQGWKRPVYFAVTVSPSGQLNLQNFFQLEGQAFRVVPIKHNDGQLGRVVPKLTSERLKRFRFRGTTDPDVYFDDNIRNMLDNYRNVYAHAAESLAKIGEKEEARELMQIISEALPFDVIPGDEQSFLLMARAYEAIGDKSPQLDLMKRLEPLVLHTLQYNARTRQEQERALSFVQIIRYTYLNHQEFELGADFSQKLATLLGDTAFVETADDLRAVYDAQFGPTEN